MIAALAILLVPILLLTLFYRFVLDGDKPASIDPGPAIEQAQRSGTFPVLTPGRLGDDWHVAAATFRKVDDGSTLRIGYVDPDDDPVQLVESSVPSATLLPAELTADAKPTGSFRSPAGVWRLYDGRPGEKALVLAEDGRTVLVVGKTDVENLEKLAGSLS